MDLVSETKRKMEKALEVLRGDLATVRTGRATPSLVENIIVSVYGGSTSMRLMELSTIAVSDSQTLLITPYDASIIGEIQKGIMEANVGLTPVIDSNIIRISIPPLSQERRIQLIHLMKQKLENGRIMIRQVRQETMNDIKKMKDVSEEEAARLEKEVQKATDEVTDKIKELGDKKEQELLQI